MIRQLTCVPRYVALVQTDARSTPAQLATSAIAGLPVLLCEPEASQGSGRPVRSSATSYAVVMFPALQATGQPRRRSGDLVVREAVVLPVGDAESPGRILHLAQRHPGPQYVTAVAACGPAKLATCAGRRLVLWDVSRAALYQTSKAVAWLDVGPAIADFMATSMQFIR